MKIRKLSRVCLAIAIGTMSLTTLKGQATRGQAPPEKTFRAGAAKSNITPAVGTSINGNMKDVTIRTVHDDTYARCIVLDDGSTRLAIVVSDLCMVYRETLDKAKQRAQRLTNIPAEHMLMSATHTHSAGTACSVFQSDPDPAYLEFLSTRIADAVVRANENLAPARIGWAVGSEPDEVFNRRWKMKPGTPMPNPFGGQDQVLMNPGVGSSGLLEPAGPTDPEIPVVSIQTKAGKPLALLANYSLHYVGGTGAGEVSADYYGMFATRMEELIGAGERDPRDPPFLAIMSNGTSGNINNINWGGEAKEAMPPYAKMRSVADNVANAAFAAFKKIRYQDWVPLSVVQKELELGVRLPSPEDITRAEAIVAGATGPVMETREEIYARETLKLKEFPRQVPVILQAMRLGELAITAIPCEVFVEIGLELKEKSPFDPTFSISLANGYNGYLPTAEHHRLGGYETWRARSSYLEVDAASKISETLFDLLAELRSGSPLSGTGSGSSAGGSGSSVDGSGSNIAGAGGAGASAQGAGSLSGGTQSRKREAGMQGNTPAELFNGKNLDGWYTFLRGLGPDRDPDSVFTVKDGIIRISGEEWGCITTDREYENYKLVVEYKWAGPTHGTRLDKARDGGILLHSTGKDGAFSDTWMYSIECQIIEGGTGDFIVVGDGSKRYAVTSPVAAEKQGSSHLFQPDGRPVTIHSGRINWYGRDPDWQDVKDFRGEKDIENPVGEWNTMECIASGEEISVLLNGTLVNRATRVKPSKGRIQIQSEGAEMWVRRVELIPLSAAER